jgi:hypothetical protein
MPSSRTSLLAILLTCASSLALSQTPLRNMPGPQGGTIIFGTVEGANTPPAAMGFILKQLHNKYGERPVVGRVFKVKNTASDAVFFTLTPHVATMKPVAGMLLVSNAPGHVEAALLSDDAARFGTSINPMLQTLFTNWRPGGKSLQPSTPNRQDANRSEAEDSSPVAPLRPYRLQDGSAMVMLAPGWQVAPQSGGGTILAEGPNGEKLALGFPYGAHDPRDPRTQQMQRFAMSPAGRNTTYAHNLYAPYGADLGRTFADLNQQAGRVGAPAVAPVQVTQVQPLSSNGGAHCAFLAGTTSGGEPLQFEGTFCQGPPDSSAGFMNLANLSFAPAQFAARDRATLRAMLGSFQVNQSIVNGQAGALAKPTIDAIHEIGRQVDARIAVSDQQNAEIKSSFEAHNDAMDRQSQGFSNYMLDKSVIRNTETGAHATAWNNTAATLVESNPSHYEYVDTQDYWKGIDY